MTVDRVEDEISEVILALSSPLTAMEEKSGWTLKSKAGAKALLEEFRRKLVMNEPLPPSLSITRSLDHWGVIEGQLLDRIARISNQLRAIQQS